MYLNKIHSEPPLTIKKWDINNFVAKGSNQDLTHKFIEKNKNNKRAVYSGNTLIYFLFTSRECMR